MTCYHPLRAYVLTTQKTENGKQLIVFDRELAEQFAYKKIDLPCSQCIGCRIDRSRDWALRCMFEASQYNYNSFITLTFDDEHLDQDGSLDKKDFQNFMKELRRQYLGTRRHKVNGLSETIEKIRYFHCGEYGEACFNCGLPRDKHTCNKYIAHLGRPHHHACIFNLDFQDKILIKEEDNIKQYVSPSLAKIWKKGLHSIGNVTFQSAAYVARYVCKKVTGARSEEYYKKVDPRSGQLKKVIPEYITMSRRPGIGKDWYEKYYEDLFPKDFITHDGKTFRVPKFYCKLFEETYPVEYQRIKERRNKRRQEKPDENTIRRLVVKHKVKKAQTKQLSRSKV